MRRHKILKFSVSKRRVCFKLGPISRHLFYSVIIVVIFYFPLLGCTEPVQLLRLLVYTAAKMGAQQFIEIIFNSSSGRVVYEAYKECPPLPEVIARDHGNEETAHYLEGITKRYILRRMKKNQNSSVRFVWGKCRRVFCKFMGRGWLI